jgi:hypothetical protein
MKKLTSLGHGMAATLLAIAASMPGTAAAQAAPASSDADKWQFNVGLYGYFPALKGQVLHKDSSSTDIDLSFSDLLDVLKMTFMGEVVVHNGRWGVFADALYMDLGSVASSTKNISVGGATFPVPTSESVDVRAWVWTVAGAYRVVSSPEWTMDVIAGARSLYLKAQLDYAVGPIGGHKETSGTAWDGIVGVKGRYAFGDKREWFVPYYVDIGTGETAFTWQGLAGIGYAFRWGDAVASWRYLDWNGKSGKPIADLNLSGPMVGVLLHF